MAQQRFGCLGVFGFLGVFGLLGVLRFLCFWSLGRASNTSTYIHLAIIRLVVSQSIKDSTHGLDLVVLGIDDLVTEDCHGTVGIILVSDIVTDELARFSTPCTCSQRSDDGGSSGD